MRSEAVFGAIKTVGSRYGLCGICSKGTRELHIPSGRVEDTINIVLLILGRERESESFRSLSSSGNDIGIPMQSAPLELDELADSTLLFQR